MSLEEGVSLNSELNSDIRTLLAEAREQRRELHSFKEELRGDCLSVKADVKRLKGGPSDLGTKNLQKC